MSVLLLLSLQPSASLHGLASSSHSLRPTLHAMMAAAKPKKKAAGGGFGGGGFGAPKPAPPTFDEVVGGWKTRVPKDAASVDCPCGFGEVYATCCRPYHQGEKAAETPEWTLRSRYVAFAYRLPEYIIRTTDKTNSDYMTDKIKWAKKLNKEQMFDDFQFKGLEVGELESGKHDEEQYLSLRVSLMPMDAAGMPKQPDPMVFTERSRFLRDAKGAWQYASGEGEQRALTLASARLRVSARLTTLRAQRPRASRSWDSAHRSRRLQGPRAQR